MPPTHHLGFKRNSTCYSTKVKKAIRKEIGDAKFCILVDEAHDESMKEQIIVVLRYVDIDGFVGE